MYVYTCTVFFVQGLHALPLVMRPASHMKCGVPDPWRFNRQGTVSIYVPPLGGFPLGTLSAPSSQIRTYITYYK